MQEFNISEEDQEKLMAILAPILGNTSEAKSKRSQKLLEVLTDQFRSEESEKDRAESCLVVGTWDKDHSFSALITENSNREALISAIACLLMDHKTYRDIIMQAVELYEKHK